ncbi:MAG: hypothetical protein ACLVCH_14945 [Roseburia inulinivorans]
MSWMKTNAKVMMDDSDATIADLIVMVAIWALRRSADMKTSMRQLDEKSKS